MTAEELINELKNSLGDNLISAVLYGSAVTGDTTDKFSDVNVFLLLKDAGVETMKSSIPTISKWTKRGNSIPLFFSEKHFARACDVFPIEFLDIKSHHRVLLGNDPFSGIKIDSADLRRQVEFELRSKLIQLRQKYLENHGRPADVRALMAKALSTFSILFKSVMHLIGEQPPMHKPDAWKSLSRHVTIDVAALDKIWDERKGKKLSDSETDAVFLALISAVEAIIDFVDQHK